MWHMNEKRKGKRKDLHDSAGAEGGSGKAARRIFPTVPWLVSFFPFLGACELLFRGSVSFRLFLGDVMDTDVRHWSQ